jgi:gliding motility-associated-like protein
LSLSNAVSGQQLIFRCTQVDSVGDIILFWQATGLPSNYQYEIYRSLYKAGPYTLLTTIPTLATTTYTDIGANGDSRQLFYLIKAVAQPPAVAPQYTSDTIGSIWLNWDGMSTGILILGWTHPSTPPLASQAKEFTIHRQRNSSWSIWGKTDDVLYKDTIHVCGETIGYEVRLYDTSGCESISFIRKAILSDRIAPSEPQLDSVSINPATGQTELGWEAGFDPDIIGYLIYIKLNGIWKVVDTVFGRNNTFYLDTTHDANDSIQQYRIAAIDTCRNSSPLTIEHTTLFLQAATKKCDSIVSLSWNRYSGMPDSLTGYRIWASENGGAFTLVDTVSSGQQSYIHRGVNPMNFFVYYVQAYNLRNGYSSTSSKTAVNFDRTPGQGSLWLRYASVINNKDIEIAVFVQDSIMYNNIFLMRSDDNGTTFSHTDSKAKINGTEHYFFTDNQVDVQTQTYFYRAAITDECNLVFAYSDTANNIVLKVAASLTDKIGIEWQPYYGFDNRLDSYDVLRKTQMETSLREIDQVPPSQLDYSENVWSVATQGGKFQYQVAATEDKSNIYGFQDKSYSNIVETLQDPISYIPNIFLPNSAIDANRTFKPVHAYVDAEDYLFSIFDRWGSLIFQTRDITAGWDGSVNGKEAMAGIYTYTITYRINPKTLFNKQGRVTLIR